MRFYKHRPITGEEREIRKFAWLPIYVDGIIYWFEWVTIHQSFDTDKPFKWSNDWVA